MRGELFELRAPRNAQGREQQGHRYAVVVQPADLPLSTWLVCPTSTRAPTASFRPTIQVGDQDTLVLVDQLTAVDPQRLGRHIGYLTRDELVQVDAALITVLGLD